MIALNTFQEIRQDNKVIPESMTADQMVDAGWEPSPVIALRWNWFGTPIQLITRFGFIAQIVPNREYVAIIEETDATGDHASLSVYRADGIVHRTFQNLMPVAGVMESVQFSWFEEVDSEKPAAFAAVFYVARSGGTFKATIDAGSGSLFGVEELRE